MDHRDVRNYLARLRRLGGLNQSLPGGRDSGAKFMPRFLDRVPLAAQTQASWATKRAREIEEAYQTADQGWSGWQQRTSAERVVMQGPAALRPRDRG